MDLVDAIKKRRSIRKFKKKNIKEKAIFDILDAGRYAPSAGNLQNWRFLVVTKDLEKISKAVVNGGFILDASAAIIVINEKDQTLREFKDQGEAFCNQSCGAAIQNMMLRATSLKIGSCWIGSFSSNKLRTAFQMKPKTEIAGLIVLGYPAESGEFERRDLRDMVNFEKLN